MAPSNTSGGGGIDLPTLAITAAASAAAAYTCSKIWAPGTLASAAFTPVLVALLKEVFARPTYAVTRAVPVRGTVRSATHDEQSPEPVPERVAQQGEIPGQPQRRARGWQMAIVTGLLGFLVCAVIITVPELVAGKAASGGGRGTTLFGGHERSTERSSPTDTTTTKTPTGTVTVPPAKTLTAPPPTTTTVPPRQGTTVPTIPTPATTTTPGPGSATPPPAAPPP